MVAVLAYGLVGVAVLLVVLWACSCAESRAIDMVEEPWLDWDGRTPVEADPQARVVQMPTSFPLTWVQTDRGGYCRIGPAPCVGGEMPCCAGCVCTCGTGFEFSCECHEAA